MIGFVYRGNTIARPLPYNDAGKLRQPQARSKKDMDKVDIKRFGRYEVECELGRGAMGVVYKARDPQIDRTVAVKTISLWGQEPEQEKEFRLRFMNEAQAAGRLHHSGIVSVFDVGETRTIKIPTSSSNMLPGRA